MASSSCTFQRHTCRPTTPTTPLTTRLGTYVTETVLTIITPRPSCNIPLTTLLGTSVSETVLATITPRSTCNQADIVALSNYTLYVHVVLHNYDRCRSLYGKMMEFMTQRGVDNAFVLYSYAIFVAVNMEEDWEGVFGAACL